MRNTQYKPSSKYKVHTVIDAQYKPSFSSIRKKSTVPEKLPPGPRGLPLVGSLPFLNPELHRWFTELAGAYGPVAMLYLGTKPCVLISSSSAAASEVLRDQDAVFANHDKAAPVVARMASYGGADMLWTAYGAHWRMVRKVTVREMMSPRSIEALGGLRRREVRRMVVDVHGRGGEEVEVRQVTFDAVLNYMMSVVWGGGLEEGKGTGREFRQLTDAFTELVGKPNVSDFFPAMAKLDVQGVERRMRELVARLDRIFDPIISERVREMREAGCGGTAGGGYKDFLQVMVVLKEKEVSEEPFTIINIKALIMNLFGGGTDTTSTTLEWAMAELLNDDTLMKAAQEELDSVVGKDTTVEEWHLPKLRYLQAVMKEVMRLHPALPLLVPHSPSQTSEVSGYTIPKDTAVFINVWAIQRDPRNWENPNEFRPQRFLGGGDRKSVEELRFLPFGAGRRGCVAKKLAERMLMHMLASLVHSFEWELPQGSSGVVLTDKYGLVLKMAKPLVAIPKPRLSTKTLYQ